MILKTFFYYFRGIRLVVLKMIAIIFLIFLAGYFLLKDNSKKDSNTINTNKDSVFVSSYNALNNLKKDYFHVILINYSCFDWMTNYIKQPQKFNPKYTITATKELHLSVFQIFDLQKNNIYCSNTGLLDGDTLVFNDSFFNKLYQKRELIFYLKLDSQIVEIHASTIHHSNDTKKINAPKGYLIIGKLWDSSYIKEVSTIIHTKISIDFAKLKNPLIEDKNLFILKDYNGKVIASITYKPTKEFINTFVFQKVFFKMYYFFLFLITVIISIFCYEYYIIKPLNILQKSLKRENVLLIGPMLTKENEFSTIAELVLEYYNQIEWARDEIENTNRTKNELNITNTILMDQKEKMTLQNFELEAQSEKLASAHYEILYKNNQLEYQNLQITDGIKYASMIQKAVLTAQFNLDKTFKDHFIFYKPKEILSGDFYWFKEFYDKYYFACADCTGHGFSGAMMSMLGISFLNELTHHQNDRNISPSIILDKLRLKVVETLHQTGEIGQIRDGMDIGLCMYNPTKKILEYSGAYNILYQMTTDEENKTVLIEHKGDRMPVGIYDKPEAFNNIIIATKKGDTFYMLTDGYIDQFGGPNKKKLNKQNFKNMLFSIQHLNLSEQRLYLKEFFVNWLGNLEQVDDVTVIAIKL